MESAGKLSPKDPIVPSLLRQIYRTQGRQADMENAARETIKLGLEALESDLTDSHTNLPVAFGYITLGNKAEARKYAEYAVKGNPDDALINYNAACLYCCTNDIDKAMKHLELALKKMTNNSQIKAWVKHDSDLDPLREKLKFRRLLDRYF